MSGAADEPLPPGHLREVVTSLEMRARPATAPAASALPPECRVEPVRRPTTAFYRFLYDRVGEPWMWVERRRWSDEALAARILDDANELLLLSCGGQPAGFAELDRRDPADVELSYFGLLPDFIGRGLGPPLLRAAVHRAWMPATRRLWVHTCDIDHPAALALYRREGFVPFRVEAGITRDPRAQGLIPRGVQPHRPIVR